MNRNQAKARGFAILIVLAVLAMATVILTLQLGSVEGQQISQIRTTEEVKARDISEYCLEIADAYAESHANAFADFDGLLDPNSTVEAAGDDFLPPADLLAGTSAIVTIPPGAAGSKYRYRAFNIDAAGPGASPGTCFIRYDDNADDVNPLFSLTTTGNSGLAEGAGIDVAERDRDRTIITTAVGVVPQQASQATAYAKAHARATVRRVRSMPIGAAIGAAIEAGGTVDFGGSICGTVAGVLADRIQGGTCVCGVVNAQLVSGSQGTTAGDCGCPSCAPSTGSSTGAGPRPNPDILIPPYGTLLNNAAFGNVDGGAANNNIAAPGYEAALVYFRDSLVSPAGYQAVDTTNVFVWDRFDDNTTNTMATVGGATLTGAGNAVTKNCTDTSALATLPRPCNWSTFGTVECAAAESPCWKLVAVLDAAAPVADLDYRTTQSRGEHSNAGGTAFTARAGDLPNVRTTGANTGEWRDMAPGPVSPPKSATIPSCTTCGGSADVVRREGGGRYRVGPDNDVANTPHMHVIIDSSGGSDTEIESLSRTGAHISVHTNNRVEIDGSNQCCATCDCPQACSAATTMTQTDNGPAYAIRTDKFCRDTSTWAIVGHVMCAQLDVANANNNCVVGGLIGLDSPGTIDCDLSGTSAAIDAICEHTANFCAKNNFDLIGDLQCAGNICLKNNLNMHAGIIESEGSIGWKNNPVAAGQIRAEGDILGKNNATITFDGTAGNAENQGVPSAVWMDAAW